MKVNMIVSILKNIKNGNYVIDRNMRGFIETADINQASINIGQDNEDILFDGVSNPDDYEWQLYTIKELIKLDVK